MAATQAAELARSCLCLLPLAAPTSHSQTFHGRSPPPPPAGLSLACRFCFRLPPLPRLRVERRG
eukprot:355515-Chlamydomonas_euryale.AAC.28